MFLWRERHPDYARGRGTPVSMLDYLAVRLALERIYAQRLCRETWQIESSLDMLRWYFRRNPEEFLCRQALHATGLPEYLATRAARAAARSDLEPGERGWQAARGLDLDLAPQPAGRRRPGPHRLPPRLGALPGSPSTWDSAATEVRALGPDGVAAILDCPGPPRTRGPRWSGSYLWLCAFERHYREQILTALAHNRGRGRFGGRGTRRSRPEAQLIFCMDDREEGIRRHLEELAPELETLGAAAHFNVPHNWLRPGRYRVSALAPVIPAPVIPAHEVREVPRPECQATGRGPCPPPGASARRGQALLQQGRLGPARSGRRLRPGRASGQRRPRLAARRTGPLRPPDRALALGPGAPGGDPDRLRRAQRQPPGGPSMPHGSGLRTWSRPTGSRPCCENLGLTDGFAPLVVILGHASRNLNNPHASAYNCGACSGRFSGPNARLVAAMANRPEVREILAGRGIEIPSGTWFVGGEHDTCNDTADWYDLPDVPAALAPTLGRLRERTGAGEPAPRPGALPALRLRALSARPGGRPPPCGGPSPGPLPGASGAGPCHQRLRLLRPACHEPRGLSGPPGLPDLL